MRALILAAGKPLLKHVLGVVKKAGIDEVTFRVEEIRSHFGDRKKFGVGIDYIIDFFMHELEGFGGERAFACGLAVAGAMS